MRVILGVRTYFWMSRMAVLRVSWLVLGLVDEDGIGKRTPIRALCPTLIMYLDPVVRKTSR